MALDETIPLFGSLNGPWYKTPATSATAVAARPGPDAHPLADVERTTVAEAPHAFGRPQHTSPASPPRRAHPLHHFPCHLRRCLLGVNEFPPGVHPASGACNLNYSPPPRCSRHRHRPTTPGCNPGETRAAPSRLATFLPRGKMGRVQPALGPGGFVGVHAERHELKVVFGGRIHMKKNADHGQNHNVRVPVNPQQVGPSKICWAAKEPSSDNQTPDHWNSRVARIRSWLGHDSPKVCRNTSARVNCLGKSCALAKRTGHSVRTMRRG